METDLTQPVMKRIVKFERQQILWWRVLFGVVMGLTLLMIMGLIYQSWQIIAERGTLDLLSLFTEDRETIVDFWQDTLATFIEELPQRYLEAAFFLAGLVGAVLLLTRKARRVIKKKGETLREFNTY